MSSAFTDRIKWSSRLYTLQSFVEEYCSSLPAVICTCSGYYGLNDVEVISRGQIVRVHAVVRQSRIYASDIRGRMFSFPETCPLKFGLMDGKRSGKFRTLAEIVKDCRLPVSVKLHPNSSTPSNNRGSDNIHNSSGNIATNSSNDISSHSNRNGDIEQETSQTISQLSDQASDQTVGQTIGSASGHEEVYEPGKGVGFWANGRWLTNSTLGTLVLIQAYSETFLHVNAISQGIIEGNIVSLPLYVDIEVRVAEGFKAGSGVGDWSLLMDMYDRAVHHSIPPGDHRSSTSTCLDIPGGHLDVLVFDRAEEPSCYPAVMQTTGQMTREFSSNMSLHLSSRNNSLNSNNCHKTSGRNEHTSKIKIFNKNYKNYNSNCDSVTNGNGNNNKDSVDGRHDSSLSINSSGTITSAPSQPTNIKHNSSNNLSANPVNGIHSFKTCVDVEKAPYDVNARSKDTFTNNFSRRLKSGRESPLIVITDADGSTSRVYQDDPVRVYRDDPGSARGVYQDDPVSASRVYQDNLGSASRVYQDNLDSASRVYRDDRGSASRVYRDDPVVDFSDNKNSGEAEASVSGVSKIQDPTMVALSSKDRLYTGTRSGNISVNDPNKITAPPDLANNEKGEETFISDSNSVTISTANSLGYGAAFYRHNLSGGHTGDAVLQDGDRNDLNTVREAMHQVDEVGLGLFNDGCGDANIRTRHPPGLSFQDGTSGSEVAKMSSKIPSKADANDNNTSAGDKSYLPLDAGETSSHSGSTRMTPVCDKNKDTIRDMSKESDQLESAESLHSVVQGKADTTSREGTSLVTISAPYRKKKAKRTGSGSQEATERMHTESYVQTKSDPHTALTVMTESVITSRTSAIRLAEPDAKVAAKSLKMHGNYVTVLDQSIPDIVEKQHRNLSNGNTDGTVLGFYDLSPRFGSDSIMSERSGSTSQAGMFDDVERERRRLHLSTLDTSNSTLSTLASTVDYSMPTSPHEEFVAKSPQHKSSTNSEHLISDKVYLPERYSKQNGLLMISNKEPLSSRSNQAGTVEMSSQNGGVFSLDTGLPNYSQQTSQSDSVRMSHSPQSVLVEIDDNLDDNDTYPTANDPTNRSSNYLERREWHSGLSTIQVGSQRDDVASLDERPAFSSQWSSEVGLLHNQSQQNQQQGLFVTTISNNQVLQHQHQTAKAMARVRPIQQSGLNENKQKQKQKSTLLQNERQENLQEKHSIQQRSGFLKDNPHEVNEASRKSRAQSNFSKFPEFSNSYSRYSPNNLQNDVNTRRRNTQAAYNSDDNLMLAPDRNKTSYNFQDKQHKRGDFQSNSKNTRRTDDFSPRRDHLSKEASKRNDYLPKDRSKVNMLTSPERKKSAIKTTSRRGGVTVRRHVSYSDTDTVYPYDTSEDDQTTSVYNTGDSGLDSDNLDGSALALYPTNSVSRQHTRGSQYVKKSATMGVVMGGASREAGHSQRVGEGVREVTQWAGRPSRRTLKYYKQRSATLQATRPGDLQEGLRTRYRILSGPLPSLGSSDLSPLGGARAWGSDAETGSRGYIRGEVHLRPHPPQRLQDDRQHGRPLIPPGRRPALSDTDLSDAERHTTAGLYGPRERTRPASRQIITNHHPSRTLPNSRHHQISEVRRSTSQDQLRTRHAGGLSPSAEIILR